MTTLQKISAWLEERGFRTKIEGGYVHVYLCLWGKKRYLKKIASLKAVEAVYPGGYYE